MRAVALALVLAACTEEGAHLTLHAPDGPTSAATYQLVLASPDLVPMIQPQRVTPAGLSTETVAYYLQRTDVNAMGTVDGVDGFTVLVQPNSEVADTAFIPFIALYDDSGALVGMGTFHAMAGGPPSPILVQRGQVDRYTLDIEPVQEVDDSMPVDTRGAMRVECTHQDQSTFLSGIVWRPRVGGELRLLLPDGDGGDATTRALDLDCDSHAVSPTDATADCDDTRARFHDGATEACDGEDTNCDSVETLAVPCTPAPGTNACTSSGGQGVAVCDDTTGTVGACMSDPTCLCAMGLQGCVKCILQHVTNTPPAGETVPCQPGIGQLSTQGLCDGGSPCTVQVLGTRGGWEAKVGASSAGFGQIATGVGSSFLLMTKRPEGPGVAIPGAPAHSVGGVDLDVIDANGGHHYFGVDLEMDATDAMCGTQTPYSMACSP
jgi:hypothetical protein